MTSKPSLYSVPHPAKSKPSTTAPNSSSSLNFTNTLSSLLAQQPVSTISSSATPSTGRSRPTKPSKDDIFKVHSRHTKKRAAAAISRDDDPSDYAKQKHKKTGVDIGGDVDAASLARSRRKMEEKASLYASMKRGEYIPPKGKEHLEESQLVDFDRKWAENEEETTTSQNGEKHVGRGEDSDDDSDGSAASKESLVDYTDTLGRTRPLPRSTALRLRQRDAAQSHAAEELASFAARPQRPTNIIHGDTVQSEAFNPDAAIARSMEALASKRDRSATPPPEVHYDASKEVRTKGVGFYQFSQDAEGRRKELDALDREREETERRKGEDEERKAKRRREEEERKRMIQKRREERLAERFLKGLDEDDELDRVVASGS